MPNSFTAADAAIVAAKLATEDATISALVSRNYQDEFLGAGSGGRVVNVKVPATLIARERGVDDVTNPLILDTITESTVPVTLGKVHDYSAVGLSEADLSLNITDFGSQVLAVQSAAIVDSLEHKLAVAMQDIDLNPDFVWDESNPIAYFTAIRKYLRDNGVPAANLNVLVGTEVYAQLLEAKAITDVSESGSTEALREGGVGRLRGFTVVETTRIPETEVFAFHRDAVTLVTRAPAVPQGASFGSTVNAGGFSLRYLRDYDAKFTQDRSIVSTFSGVGFLPTFKVERNYTARTVSLSEVEAGGVLHLDTADSGV